MATEAAKLNGGDWHPKQAEACRYG